MIPTDGRPHSEEAEYNITYLGDTVGRWESDTLVLDSIGFTDRTWLGRGGFFHTDRMHVVERFTRQGNAVLYDVTVEDPACWWSRGCCRHGRWCPTRIPTAGFCESEVTARFTKTSLKLTRFGTRRGAPRRAVRPTCHSRRCT